MKKKLFESVGTNQFKLIRENEAWDKTLKGVVSFKGESWKYEIAFLQNNKSEINSLEPVDANSMNYWGSLPAEDVMALETLVYNDALKKLKQ